jgi:hypothetical protein
MLMPGRYLENILHILVIACFMLPVGEAFPQETSPIVSGAFFPQIPMKPISNEADRIYLGLANDQFFSTNDIKTDLILVEIMNTNCVSCKKQAVIYNELFSLIESDPAAKSRIKMIGIAVGNSDKEIQAFKDQFMILFPIVGDPQYMVWDATGRSRTPLSVFVRQAGPGNTGVVAGAHLGLQTQAKAVLDKLKLILKKDSASFSVQRAGDEKETMEPAPVFTQQRIMELIAMTFFKAGVISERIETIKLSKSGVIYTSTGKRNGKPVRLFAKPIHRFLPCDACHEAQFLYFFEGDGKIFDLVPMQLTKYGNQPFTETDLSKISSQFVGKFIFDDFVFDPHVDAVSAATITSSVIYKTFNEGKVLYEEIKAAGLSGA